jgi:peptidoglycan/xylan/chitin deacetylase (PgdA/CDA1 family)
MRFIRMPWFLKLLMRKAEWRKLTQEKAIYLTFDDGPIPEVTDFVLQQLAKFNAKATFFAVGENVQKHPDILQQIIAQGHQIGNHTFNHFNGWKTEPKRYLENVKKCEDTLKPYLPAEQPRFFRPPYGKLTLAQLKPLSQQYRLIFWDLLTYDFDATFSPEACLKISLAKTRPGSIVVFHDSLKAQRNLEYVLPRYLEALQKDGYSFRAL